MSSEVGIGRCLNPSEVSQADFAALEAGESRPRFEIHLAKCAFCQDEYRQYVALADFVSHKIGYRPASRRANCPPTQSVGEYSLGLLEGRNKANFEAHLLGCRYCQAELTVFQTDLRSEPVAGPVPRNSVGLRQAVGEALRRVTAVFLPAQAGLALRSAAGPEGAGPQVFRFEADALLVVVQVLLGEANLAHTLSVSGSLSPQAGAARPSSAAGVVELWQAHSSIAQTHLDEFGSFDFDDIALPVRAAFSLQIRLSDRIITVPDVPFP